MNSTKPSSGLAALALVILALALADSQSNSQAPLQALDKIAEQQSWHSPSEEAEFFRHFIHAHSVHVIDAEHDAYAYHTGKLLRRILHHYQNGGSLPHAACGPRARALLAVLQHRQIQARLVHSFSSHYDALRGHTFLEVFNPERGCWEQQDPDFDFSFRRKADPKQRLSTEELVSLPADELLLMGPRGPIDWPSDPFYHSEVHLHRFYDAMAYFEGGRMHFTVNPEKFDLSKRFPHEANRTLEEIIQLRYPGADLRIL